MFAVITIPLNTPMGVCVLNVCVAIDFIHMCHLLCFYILVILFIYLFFLILREFFSVMVLLFSYFYHQPAGNFLLAATLPFADVGPAVTVKKKKKTPELYLIAKINSCYPCSQRVL